MFKTKDDEKIVTIFVQAIGAGCALIGLLANPDREGATDYNVGTAWEYGDKMAAEFIRRAKAEDEKSGL